MEGGMKNTNEPILSRDVKKQLYNLGLTPEMIKGEILDIGAGDAELACAFINKKDARITSVDQRVDENNKDFVFEADSRKLPFVDNSYDMVISHASVPHVFLQMYSFQSPEHSAKEIKSAVVKSLLEIIRVLKNGKKAYISPVLIAENYESQRILKNIIIETIDELREAGITISFELLRNEVNPENKEKSSSYRLIIQKP